MKNQPLSGNAMPRFAGLATMMRLPAAESPHGLMLVAAVMVVSTVVLLYVLRRFRWL